ncbi:MAG: DUF917 domain-containing protein [Asgard group archaeon]|nr:DUF917 domain-containing protein [Asgard group archaeon]
MNAFFFLFSKIFFTLKKKINSALLHMGILELKLQKQSDFDDLIIGAKILGCGGGGEETLAKSRVKYILENNLIVNVIDPKDIPDEALICVSGMVGGRTTKECLANVKGLSEIDSWPMFTATKLLESYLGEKLHSLVSTEIGAGNFLVPILVSARLGINVIDGDLCGRAKPEISISTSNVVGIPITPLAIVSSYGDEMVLKTAQTDQRAERIAREIAVLSGGGVGVARCPAHWKDYKKAVIPNTISKSMKLGTAIRIARDKNKDPIKAINDVIEGKVLFEGKVKTFAAEDEGGFVLGELYLEDNQNNNFKIWFKNEYLITWFNDKPFATSPDIICVVDSETGEGLTPWSNDFLKNRSVVVLGTKNDSVWYSKRGLEIFGPRHFGFDFDYQSFQ